MTKLLRFTIPSAAALAVATALGLATAPAQAAAVVTYNGCTSTSFCTLTELLAGGSITVDENGDGIADKEFINWMAMPFSPGSSGLADPKNNIQVSATGTYIPGVSGSATLNYTVVNNALNVAPTGNATWAVSLDFGFDVKSAEFLPIIEQKDALTGGSVLGPATGTASKIALNGAELTSGGVLNSIPPLSPVTNTDNSPATPVNLHSVMNNLSLSARRTNTVLGTANITSFSQTFNQVVIPEPGTVVGLLAVGGLGLAMKRRQKDN